MESCIFHTCEYSSRFDGGDDQCIHCYVELKVSVEIQCKEKGRFLQLQPEKKQSDTSVTTYLQIGFFSNNVSVILRT